MLARYISECGYVYIITENRWWTKIFIILRHCHPTLYLIETSFNAFANRADPDQAALVKAV